MSTPSRLAEIKSFVEMSPQDPFPLYGLAMEYRTTGDLAEARRTFERLAEKFPAYVPQYLMHAKLLIELGERAAARQVLTVGIDKARAARNGHALGEMQAELAGLGEGDGDDE
jgi:tetratricopeptide (TPR) repeat protein